MKKPASKKKAKTLATKSKKKTAKPAARKVVKKSAKPATKKSAVKKSTRKPVAKKSVKKVVAKKASTKKAVAKKSVKKTAIKRVVAKKVVAKKVVAPIQIISKTTWPPEVMEVLAQLDDSKAEQIVTIDLSKKSTVADTMIVASGRSNRHVNAIADQAVERLGKLGVKNIRVEGVPQCDWVLVDAGNIILHIFRPEVRSFYNLEKLWSEHAP